MASSSNRPKAIGASELLQTCLASWKLFWFIALFSALVNLLMLTGPIYMLQVYDRVLGSRSVETLIGLTGLVAFLYGMMGLLDYSRGRVMGRVGARFQKSLDRRVFDAVVRKSANNPDQRLSTGLSDLGAVQRLITSPVALAIFDIPWTPIFLAGIWMFHPWLGILALVGGSLLVVLAALNQLMTRGPVANATVASLQSDNFATQIKSEAGTIKAIGMLDSAAERWLALRGEALKQQIRSLDVAGTFSVTAKTFRLFLQSAMLGVGAYLVLLNELTPGAMIASSILLGRALAPVEVTVGQWDLVQRALKGWARLGELLEQLPPEAPRINLPRPEAHLILRQVTVVPPGAKSATLKNVSFAVVPGEAVGVIGVTGSGKSTLAKTIAGEWYPVSGEIRLGGAALDQYAPSFLGQHIGYLPQRIQLFDGTISENIARLVRNPDPEKVVEAAKRADAHEMILRFPQGYDTRVAAEGAQLSSGQLQRVGLARAMYEDPVILVLDEPNSNLDNEGSEAVNHAIRKFKEAGRSVLIIAHRPGSIRECDRIIMLENGVLRFCGPKDEVLRTVVDNNVQIAKNLARAGLQ